MGAMTLYCMHQLLRCRDYYQYRFGLKMKRVEIDNSCFFFLFSIARQKCDFGDIMRYTLATCRWKFATRYAKLGK